MSDIVLLPARENDCRDLWSWRNHPDVIKNFFDSKPVSWQHHKQWFVSKINDPGAHVYIAMIGKDKVGTIRFEEESTYVKVSVNLNPDYFGRELGSKIIAIGTERIFSDKENKKSIVAEIKKDNIASQKAFEKAGYEFLEEGAGKIIYCRREK